MDAEARLRFAVELVAADGASPGELALAADALALQRGFILEAVLPIPPRPVGGPGADVAVLAEFGADFLLLGHPSDGLMAEAELTGLVLGDVVRHRFARFRPAASTGANCRCSSPARSSNDLLKMSASSTSAGGGPTAPRSIGEYRTSYLCLATERMSPGSRRLSVTRTPLTFTPLRLCKSRTYQYPPLTVIWQWCAETFENRSTMSQLSRRPTSRLFLSSGIGSPPPTGTSSPYMRFASSLVLD